MEQTRDELDRWMQLRHWKPPPGCRSKDCEYTRTEAIDVLEDALVRLRDTGQKTELLESIEVELLMHYRDLDGEWDDIPLSIAAIPGIWCNLTLMHLCAYLDDLPDDAIVAGCTDIDHGVLNDFFRSWTPFGPEQLLVQSSRALIFLGEPEVEKCQVRSVPLPHWVRRVEELIVSALLVSGHAITAKELQKSIARYIVTSYLEDLET